MRKIDPEIRAFYNAYMKKRLRPETALEVASGFVFDLVNAFGDSLQPGAAPKDGWVPFRPAAFLLELNAVLSRFKSAGGSFPGYDALSDIEKSLCTDNSLLLGSLLQYALHSSDPQPADEDHFQIPKTVAEDLENLSQES